MLIEDQVSPKRCGHTKGKAVVSRQEAYARVQAAVDARNEGKLRQAGRGGGGLSWTAGFAS